MYLHLVETIPLMTAQEKRERLSFRINSVYEVDESKKYFFNMAIKCSRNEGMHSSVEISYLSFGKY